ncbi:flavin reductase [bacterium]|nr:MAG: flavin reductase [bacterium]
MNLSDKKRALKMFQYGLYILTAKATDPKESMPYAAATVTWVSQASFEPPLVMVGIRNESWANEAVKQSKSFALNVLGKNQKAMASKFFKEVHLDGNKINGCEFEAGVTGAPLFLEANAALECSVEERIKKGDHTIVIGKIVNARLNETEDEPMLLRDTGWSYGG